MKDFQETSNIEYKRSWRDEWLKWICAFANAQGGRIFIGIDEKNRKVVGVDNAQRLLEDIPNKVIASMGIMPKFEIENREEKQIVVITVSPAAYPVSYHGEFHVRVGATKQVLTGPALTQFILANTFYRGGFVETWGRGIDKVCRECKRLGVALPTYEATASDVMVSLEALITRPDIQLEGTKSGTKSALSQAPSRQPMSFYDQILQSCVEPQSARSLMKLSGRTNLTKFRLSVLAKMLAEGVISLTIPDVPNSRLQKYRTTGKGRSTLRKRIEIAQDASPVDTTMDGINETINDTLNEAINDGINEAINEAIKERPGINKPGLITLIGKSKATVERAISALISSGKVEHRGSKKTGGYYAL